MNQAITTTVCIIMLSACLPFGHPGIPDKAEVTPTPRPTPAVTPIPQATPEESSCDMHVRELQDEVEGLRDSLREVAPGESCYCGDD